MLYTGGNNGFGITFKEGEATLAATITDNASRSTTGLRVYDVTLNTVPTSEVEIKVTKTNASIDPYYDYYEVDIGTTGTTAGNYPVKVYNDGSTITRGAARIVYSRFKNGGAITDLSKKYLFYTYNHYNDFQEYLNYYGGWGEMFGNITGGGELSSKYDYNPTPYIPVYLYDFATFCDYSYASTFSQYLPN